MADYIIQMKNGTEIDVPVGAEVLDYGYSLEVREPHSCTCGDRHHKTLHSLTRKDVAYASVTANGMAMVIVRRQLEEK